MPILLPLTFTAPSDPTDLVAAGFFETALRLVLSMVAAALIGWERERKQRPAGLRTHILVGMGACLFTLLTFDSYARLVGGGGSLDPMRAIEGIIGGVGFLGGGAILQSRGAVTGLTTAAGIWVVAAIGVAAALGNYQTVLLTTALAWITLQLLGKLDLKPEGDAAGASPRAEQDPAT